MLFSFLFFVCVNFMECLGLFLKSNLICLLKFKIARVKINQVLFLQMTSRQKYLDDLDEFLKDCQTKVTNMLDTLGWTPDHFLQVYIFYVQIELMLIM